MNNLIIIAAAVAAYLYFANDDTPSGPTATAPATGTTPQGIAVGEFNPATPTYTGGGGGETDPRPLGWQGGPRPVQSTNPTWDNYQMPWWYQTDGVVGSPWLLD